MKEVTIDMGYVVTADPAVWNKQLFPKEFLSIAGKRSYARDVEEAVESQISILTGKAVPFLADKAHGSRRVFGVFPATAHVVLVKNDPKLAEAAKLEAKALASIDAALADKNIGKREADNLTAEAKKARSELGQKLQGRFAKATKAVQQAPAVRFVGYMPLKELETGSFVAPIGPGVGIKAMLNQSWRWGAVEGKGSGLPNPDLLKMAEQYSRAPYLAAVFVSVGKRVPERKIEKIVNKIPVEKLDKLGRRAMAKLRGLSPA